MNDWIPLNQTEINLPSNKPAQKTLNFELLVSPYDVPRAIKGYLDRETNKFIIEFRYLEDLPKYKRRILSEHLVIYENKRGRILSIEIDVEKNSAEAVSLAIKTLDVSSNKVSPPNYNYLAIKNALEQSRASFQ